MFILNMHSFVYKVFNMAAYKPKKWEVAGFDLVGRRLPDGRIRLGTGEGGTVLDDFPETAEFDGLFYALEEIKKSKNDIEWGIYA